jgi:hypothetical protein
MGALRANIGSYPGVRKSQIGFVCIPRAFPFAGSLRWIDAFLLREATTADAPKPVLLDAPLQIKHIAFARLMVRFIKWGSRFLLQACLRSYELFR